MIWTAKQGWRDSNPQPPVLETGALPNWSYTPQGVFSLAQSIPPFGCEVNPTSEMGHHPRFYTPPLTRRLIVQANTDATPTTTAATATLSAPTPEPLSW